jgi:hypothetical protein
MYALEYLLEVGRAQHICTPGEHDVIGGELLQPATPCWDTLGGGIA